MGIESDQVVYEYLSRVGDVAQQRQLPSATRMRLVSELRGEIDRRRAKTPVDSPAAVRRIIARLGTPDEVVTAAGGAPSGGGAESAPQGPVTSVPVQPDSPGAAGRDRPKGLRRIVPRPRAAEPSTAADDVPRPPHLASAAELGGSAVQLDWWRVDSSPFGPGEDVPGFVGGVEIPEMLRRPPAQDDPRTKEPAEEPAPVAVEKAEPAPRQAPRRRLFRRPALPAGRWSNPLLLLAAALLVAGAVLGNLVVLLLGWLIAWGSRRLSDAETKWAVVILPGLSLTAGVLWLWGRATGRWGDPLAEGQTNAAIGETWPWVLRGAALASALFIVWRSQRRT